MIPVSAEAGISPFLIPFEHYVTLMRRRRPPAADLAVQNQKGRNHRDGHHRKETIDVIESQHGRSRLHQFVDQPESLLLRADNLPKVMKAWGDRVSALIVVVAARLGFGEGLGDGMLFEKRERTANVVQ